MSEKIIMGGKLEQAKKEGFCYFYSDNPLLPPLYMPLQAISPEFGIFGIVSFAVELVPAVNSYNQPCFYFKPKAVLSFEKKKFN